MNRLLNILIVLFLLASKAMAQDVMVTVTPVQQVLPPQALLYVDNPGKYFNVALTNVTSQSMNVYLTMEIERSFPNSCNILATPQNHQTTQPITIPANRTVQLSMVEMKHLFSHLSASEIRMANDIYKRSGRGGFGLMLEGRYSVSFTAFKWTYPQLSNPVAVSNPLSGRTDFYVSYIANAPEFFTPFVNHNLQGNVADLDPLNAQFTWKESVITSYPSRMQYYYSLRVVEVLDGQPVDYAMEHNPVVYQIRNLVAPVCIIPVNYIQSRFSEGHTYAAQVTATPRYNKGLSFVLVNNSGKSDIRLFRIVPVAKKVVEPLDTLFDEELMQSVELCDDDDEMDYSVEANEMVIEDCQSSVITSELRLSELDSICRYKYRDIHLSNYLMQRMTFAAAKKAGLTQKAMDAYNVITTSVEQAKSDYENASVQYINSYKALKRLDKMRNCANGVMENESMKSVYDECLEALNDTKSAAHRAKEHYETIKMTAARAKNELRYFDKDTKLSE